MVTDGLHNKTLVWKFVESLVPARVVHVVCKDQKKEDNKYAQITVRFHTKQVSIRSVLYINTFKVRCVFIYGFTRGRGSMGYKSISLFVFRLLWIYGVLEHL